MPPREPDGHACCLLESGAIVEHIRRPEGLRLPDDGCYRRSLATGRWLLPNDGSRRPLGLRIDEARLAICWAAPGRVSHEADGDDVCVRGLDRGRGVGLRDHWR